MTTDIVEKVREIALGIKACVRVERLKACPETVSQQVINDCDEILAALEVNQPTCFLWENREKVCTCGGDGCGGSCVDSIKAKQPTTTDKAYTLASAQWLDDCAEGMEEEGLDRENNARHFRAGAEAIRAALMSAPIKGE